VVALEHQAEACREQDQAVFGAVAPLDEDLAGVEAEVDVHVLAHAHGLFTGPLSNAPLLWPAAVANR
jgi:hypothetical protein